MELHRGRLIDHIQLVVKDIAASKRFYKAVFEVLKIPLGGEADDHIWADELFISTKESDAALGQLTGRVHLAFQGKDRETVQRFHQAALAAGGRDNVTVLISDITEGPRVSGDGRLLGAMFDPRLVVDPAAIRAGQEPEDAPSSGS